MGFRVLTEFIDRETGRRHVRGPTDHSWPGKRAAELVERGFIAEEKAGPGADGTKKRAARKRAKKAG